MLRTSRPKDFGDGISSVIEECAGGCLVAKFLRICPRIYRLGYCHQNLTKFFTSRKGMCCLESTLASFSHKTCTKSSFSASARSNEF